MKIAQKCELTTDCFHEAIQCNGKNYLRLSQITVLFIFINCMNLRKLHYSFDVLASQLKSKQNNNTKIIQFSLVTQLCPTLCDPMDHSMPGLPVHHQLPKFTQTHESVMPSSHLILCLPLLLLPSIFPNIGVFSNQSGGQSIGVSASTSVLSMNTQD